MGCLALHFERSRTEGVHMLIGLRAESFVSVNGIAFHKDNIWQKDKVLSGGEFVNSSTSTHGLPREVLD